MLSPAGDIDTLSGRTVVLSTAYFPPVEFFCAAARAGKVLLERFESYQKQTYRNRCRILAANGVETLTLPVIHGESRLIGDVSIDRSAAWVRQHEGALVSAYRTSPFFIYYQDDIFACIENGGNSLFEYNLNIIRVMAELLGLKADIGFTDTFRQDYGEAGYQDLREAIHPKRPAPRGLSVRRDYYQVFTAKYGYVPSLSALDLLFNEGPAAVSYLL